MTSYLTPLEVLVYTFYFRLFYIKHRRKSLWQMIKNIYIYNLKLPLNKYKTNIKKFYTVNTAFKRALLI